jgi:hypothetical protein
VHSAANFSFGLWPSASPNRSGLNRSAQRMAMLEKLVGAQSAGWKRWDFCLNRLKVKSPRLRNLGKNSPQGENLLPPKPSAVVEIPEQLQGVQIPGNPDLKQLTEEDKQKWNSMSPEQKRAWLANGRTSDRSATPRRRSSQTEQQQLADSTVGAGEKWDCFQKPKINTGSQSDLPKISTNVENAGETMTPPRPTAVIDIPESLRGAPIPTSPDIDQWTEQDRQAWANLRPQQKRDWVHNANKADGAPVEAPKPANSSIGRTVKNRSQSKSDRVGPALRTRCRGI